MCSKFGRGDGRLGRRREGGRGGGRGLGGCGRFGGRILGLRSELEEVEGVERGGKMLL